MKHDDNDMPAPLRDVVHALRAPTTPPDPDADEHLRTQVRAMARALAPVLPDPPRLSSASPAAASRRSWQRVLPALTLALGVGLGAALHARFSPPVERVVVREVVREVLREVARPPTPTPSAPERGAATTLSDDGRARANDGLHDGRLADGGAATAPDDPRVRAQLILAEQRLDDGDVEDALRRLRVLEHGASRSPTLLGFREFLFVRALRAAGDDEGARRHGARYIARFPESAYARDIRDALARSAP